MSGDVDFVVGDVPADPGPDGELDAPRDPISSRGRLVAVGAVAAAVVAVVITQHRDPPTPVTVQPAVTRAATPPPHTSRPATPPTRPLTDVELLARAELVPACPRAADGQSACGTDASVPAALLAAVRASFPTVRRLSGVTQLLRDTGPTSVTGLWTRRLTTDTGMLIVIRRRELDEVPAGDNLLRQTEDTIVFAQQQVGEYLVTVAVRGHAPTADLVASIAALVDDQRLLATR